MSEEHFLENIEKHKGIIQKLLFLYVNDPDDKKDLFQEIVLQAWRSIKHFRGEARFSTWLYRLSLNTILTFLKKSQRMQKEGLDSVSAISEQVTETSDNSRRLLLAIKQLNDIDKAIITLHLEDYGNDEISEMMGISRNHVAVKLHRIKDQLKKLLTTDERIEKNVG